VLKLLNHRSKWERIEDEGNLKFEAMKVKKIEEELSVDVIFVTKENERHGDCILEEKEINDGKEDK
jgi:hypothetical protein